VLKILLEQVNNSIISTSSDLYVPASHCYQVLFSKTCFAEMHLFPNIIHQILEILLEKINKNLD